MEDAELVHVRLHTHAFIGIRTQRFFLPYFKVDLAVAVEVHGAKELHRLVVIEWMAKLSHRVGKLVKFDGPVTILPLPHRAVRVRG